MRRDAERITDFPKMESDLFLRHDLERRDVIEALCEISVFAQPISCRKDRREQAAHDKIEVICPTGNRLRKASLRGATRRSNPNCRC